MIVNDSKKDKKGYLVTIDNKDYIIVICIFFHNMLYRPIKIMFFQQKWHIVITT